MDGIHTPIASLNKHNRCISIDKEYKNGCLRGVLKNKCTTRVTVYFAAEKETNSWEIDMTTLDVGAQFASQFACIQTGRYVLLTSDAGAIGIMAPSRNQSRRVFKK